MGLCYSHLIVIPKSFTVDSVIKVIYAFHIMRRVENSETKQQIMA